MIQSSSLLGNPVQRVIIIEAEVTRVNDVVRLCVARKLIQLPKIACIDDELLVLFTIRPPIVRTSDICYTEHTRMSDLLHATLIWVERTSSWDGTAGLTSSVREVCLRVCARLGGRLLWLPYQYRRQEMRQGVLQQHTAMRSGHGKVSGVLGYVRCVRTAGVVRSS